MAEGLCQADGFPRSAHTECTVLLVENDANLRTLIELLLLREGYRVLPAADIETALQRHMMTPADLLILDPSLPRTDPSALRSSSEDGTALGRLPVLMVSAYSEEVCRAKLPDLDAEGYLPKPFRSSDLSAAVDRILHND